VSGEVIDLPAFFSSIESSFQSFFCNSSSALKVDSCSEALRPFHDASIWSPAASRDVGFKRAGVEWTGGRLSEFRKTADGGWMGAGRSEGGGGGTVTTKQFHPYLYRAQSVEQGIIRAGDGQQRHREGREASTTVRIRVWVWVVGWRGA